MTDSELSEQVLRVRVLDAQRQLDAVRAAIAAKQVTRTEGDYAYQAAFHNYSQALRCFSDLAVHGRHPREALRRAIPLHRRALGESTAF